MFGVGPQEMVIIGLLLLIVFGPSKLPSMARDVGRFVNQARRYKDEFQDQLVPGADYETSAHEKTFDLRIQKGVMTPAEITVDKGDAVKLWISSDGPIRVHLRAYDLSAEVEPGERLDLPFDATIAGRFGIENQSSETGEVLGELLVRPA